VAPLAGTARLTFGRHRLRDVQLLAGHASLADIQRYIDQSHEAKRRVLAMYVEA
jgi:hypothetical protein